MDTKGWYNKFEVRRVSTGEVEKGITFTLCPERDDVAAAALLLYGRLIGDENPALYRDIFCGLEEIGKLDVAAQLLGKLEERC